jgi:hypothetical protein
MHFREQQGRWVGIFGAHIVRRTSQGREVETDLSAPRFGDLRSSPVDMRLAKKRQTLPVEALAS